jgi:hypothetical protein
MTQEPGFYPRTTPARAKALAARHVSLAMSKNLVSFHTWKTPILVEKIPVIHHLLLACRTLADTFGGSETGGQRFHIEVLCAPGNTVSYGCLYRLG